MLSTAPDETRGLRVWARAQIQNVCCLCAGRRRGEEGGTRAEIAPLRVPPTFTLYLDRGPGSHIAQHMGVLGEPLVTRLCQVQERKTTTECGQ